MPKKIVDYWVWAWNKTKEVIWPPIREFQFFQACYKNGYGGCATDLYMHANSVMVWNNHSVTSTIHVSVFFGPHVGKHVIVFVMLFWPESPINAFVWTAG